MKKKVINKQKWTEKIIPVKEIGKEPPLNKEGFWEKRQYPIIEIKKDGGK